MLRLVEAPTTVPVTLWDAQDHLRLSSEVAENAYVEGLIAAAKGHVEQVTGRVFGEQTWELLLDEFPTRPIYVPLPPLIAVESVSYVASDGSTQAWAGFQVDLPGGRILPAYGTFYPITRAVPNAVTIRFRCGYVEAPDALRSAMLLIVGDLYENREAQSTAVLNTNKTVDRLLAPYRAY